MKIIGLTGRSGCGKSTVAQHYRSLGYPVADADQVARQVLESGSACIAPLVQAFGNDILDEQGEVRRRLLADRAFSTPQGAKLLTDITHPEIIRRLLQQAEQAKQAGSELFFVDGAIIVGAPFEPYCDAIVLVTAPQQQAVCRICARDNITQQSALLRLNAQMPQEQLQAACQAEICNDGSLQTLLQRADAVLNLLKGGM